MVVESRTQVFSIILIIDGDEVDGYDETICPVDYQSAGQIVDDVIFFLKFIL
jgi:hypothetical protein